MKIERQKKPEQPKFRDMRYGDVFLITEDGNIYIRYHEVGSHSDGSVTNCVNLANGVHRWVDPDNAVIPQPHAKLVI